MLIIYWRGRWTSTTYQSFVGLFICVWWWWSKCRCWRREVEVGNNWATSWTIYYFQWFFYLNMHTILVVFGGLKLLGPSFFFNDTSVINTHNINSIFSDWSVHWIIWWCCNSSGTYSISWCRRFKDNGMTFLGHRLWPAFWKHQPLNS